jgi:long-chain fatty acid transport protein
MRVRLVATAVALAAITTQVHATEGINLIGIGPVQQGTAGAGVASAKDSTWLILNPAGLTDVEMGVDASLQYFAPVRTVAIGTGKQEDDSAFVIPSLSGSFGCCHGENGFIGLGLYGTSGMGVDYNPGIPGMGSMTEISIAKMTATYAYKAGDSGFSVGAGPIFVLSRLRTDMMGSSGEWDTAYGAGAIVGVNQNLGPITIGGSYMSEQFMSDFDDYKALMPESFNLPQQLTVGAAWNMLENLELALDYRWVGWKELDTLGDQWGWDNQNIVKAGVTWGVSDALTLRGGISYGESPIDEDTAAPNALFPAIMETHLACGASYAWEKWAAHLAYIHALENEITATGGGPTISMYQNSLTAGVTYKF